MVLWLCPLSPNVSVSTFLFSEPPHPYFVLDEDEEHPGLPREAHGGLMAALPLETPVRRTRLGAAVNDNNNQKNISRRQKKKDAAEYETVR